MRVSACETSENFWGHSFHSQPLITVNGIAYPNICFADDREGFAIEMRYDKQGIPSLITHRGRVAVEYIPTPAGRH